LFISLNFVVYIHKRTFCIFMNACNGVKSAPMAEKP